MSKEFAGAAARWRNLLDVDFEPRIVAVWDGDPAAGKWFEDQLPTVERVYSDYRDLIADRSVEAVYCAVLHHSHARICADVIHAGKHLLGEKPIFGIDRDANRALQAAIESRPDVVVRSSSAFPFFPGAQRIVQWVNQGRFGRIVEVEAGCLHSSDLGDLGMLVMHLPLRFGWKPANVRALLRTIAAERPDGSGGTDPSETRDHAILSCDVKRERDDFPMLLSMKRVAPGHDHTSFIRIQGTEFSAEVSTRNPKPTISLPSAPGLQRTWQVVDALPISAYGTVTTDGIFEFGYSDAMLQMVAAFCDEAANGKTMKQPFFCALPDEAADSRRVFDAALESERTGQTVAIDW